MSFLLHFDWLAKSFIVLGLFDAKKVTANYSFYPGCLCITISLLLRYIYLLYEETQLNNGVVFGYVRSVLC